MKLEKLFSGEEVEKNIKDILWKIHEEGPLSGEDLESLSYYKLLQPDIFKKYEKKLLYLMGLFYKIGQPESLIEETYSIFAEAIKQDCGGKRFTPFQGDAYKKINEKKFFSFSAPTSAGKSYLFRELILEEKKDIIIVVPSRALIAEYMHKVKEIVNNDKNILVLPFIDNINIKRTKRRIFIITPERGVELFKLKDNLDIGLFLFDEAQISEEKIRGMQFDTFVRRSNQIYPNAKKVFAHPFIRNPEAQLEKHLFNQSNSASSNYNQLSVGKICLSFSEGKFSYFSPFKLKNGLINTNTDIVNDILLEKRGTILIYVSKNSIYNNECINKYKRYIDNCETITNTGALKYIEKLKKFIGASDTKDGKHSTMISLMKKGIVIHHGSIPLKARYIIEDFIKDGYANICFSTATLLQGINMPFDAVWIDNFKFEGVNLIEDNKILSLKNLIGRAGRNKGNNDFDYGYVIVEKKNIREFSKRITKDINISSISRLDETLEKIPDDIKDLYDAFKTSGFDDELYLPKNQIERMERNNIDKDIIYILENLLINDIPVKGEDYYKISTSERRKIKAAFKNIYLSFLRRSELGLGEKNILSTAIPMLLWRIQGKTFKEIIGLRQAYITQKDKQLDIKYELRDKKISSQEAKEKTISIKLIFSQPADSLPNIKLVNKYSLFPKDSKLNNFKYDILVYDTYDYIDKVLTFSLINPLSAAFHVFYTKTNDNRALIMENYIRYGTNDVIEIMLLRYGFSFEEIEWIKQHVEKIDENEIVFKNSIETLNSEEMDTISRYLL